MDSLNIKRKSSLSASLCSPSFTCYKSRLQNSARPTCSSQARDAFHLQDVFFVHLFRRKELGRLGVRRRRITLPPPLHLIAHISELKHFLLACNSQLANGELPEDTK
jgi:hypothetical protein